MIEMYLSYYRVEIWPKVDPKFCISEEKTLVVLPSYHLLFHQFLINFNSHRSGMDYSSLHNLSGAVVNVF